MRLFLFLTSLCVSLSAQVPEYLPLQVGNQWVYRGGFLSVVDITDKQTFSGQDYYLVNGIGDAAHFSAWLRRNSDGDYLAYDTQQKQESPWLKFSAPLNEMAPSGVFTCNPVSTITSRTTSDTFPIGGFSNITDIHYAVVGCADTGLKAEQWLPYIGLLRRTEDSIRGPVVSDLVYARINGVILVTAPEQGFGIALDNLFYPVGCTAPVLAHARLTLKGNPITLQFSSGKEFDLVLRDAQGTALTFWSLGIAFSNNVHQVVVNGEKNWIADLRLVGKDGGPLAMPGTYTVEGYLVNSDPPQYRAQTSFTIPETGLSCRP
jgi:Intracellular proteinase inhibitor